ncbi:aldo/keto reductase, partial [Leptolyngbya sp. FACHB-36]|uniref:aldo/keto reductase n=1 Tax=Leptolyngbya sp. FACHB-36 TaxID=2692808 RepID=UPI001680F345
QGIGVIPWSPLARGFLAGNRQQQGYGSTIRAKTDDFAHKLYYQESDFQVVDRVIELAQNHGVPPAQIALAWLLHQPSVTAPIIGASKPGHLEDAIAAVDLHLTDDEQAQLEQPYTPHPILGHG